MKSTLSAALFAARTLTSTIALAAASAACGTGEESVSPTVQMIDRTSQALSTGTLVFANGTYDGCTSRTGSWSARISGTDISDPMPNPPLSVVMGDTACRLTLTELEADATYTGTPSIEMVTAYAGTASAFAAGASPVAFYGNAKLDALTYESGFTMSILFSDNLADASDSTSAQYAAVSSTVSETQVPAPDYDLSFGALTLQTNVGDVVQSASGTIAADATDQTGEFYVISTAALGSSFAEIDSAYKAGTPAALGASIDATAFGLVGATLPTVRNVIIVHTVSGVNAYQVIRVTFNPAA